MKVLRLRHVPVNANGNPLGPTPAFRRDALRLGEKSRPEIRGAPDHGHVVGNHEVRPVGVLPTRNTIDLAGRSFCVTVEDVHAGVHELDAWGLG
jgi:hypothetical protein